MSIAGFAETACGFPVLLRFSSKSEKAAREAFSRAAIECGNAQGYLSFSMFAALAAGGLMGAASALLFSDAALSAGMFLFSSGIFSLFLLRLPSILASRREKMAESELPYLLRELAIYIDIGVPYESCIERLAKGNYELAREFASARRETASGASVQAAFARLSASTGSLPLKRSLQLVSTIYETGKGTEPLRRMADELSAAQISEMRAQAGKFSMLAIAFIAVSALIPSFFSVFAAVSPLVLSEPVQQWQVWLCFLAVFPALDAVALGAMFLLLPPVKNEKANGDALPEYLAGRGIRASGSQFAIALAALSLLLAALCLAAGSIMLAFLSICMGPAIYSLASYFSEAEMRRAELLLPDALYTAASTHKLLSAEKMLALLSKGGFGRVSDAFALALARQKAGDSFQSSMQAAARCCPTPLASRAFSLIIVAYETGADMYSALRECAQDVVSFFALLRERAALLSIQRYTVLASSAILVPFILGTVAYLAPTLSGASVAGTGAAPDAALLSALATACQIYLVMNAALCALLLALSESNPARAALYFAVCAPLALIFYSVASSSALALG
ncbi:MAG: type II secretion system F family protein [Candidatus Micrarchaeia archaeon]